MFYENQKQKIELEKLFKEQKKKKYRFCEYADSEWSMG